MADLTKDEFEEMYDKLKAKEAVLKKGLDKMTSERVILKESVKKKIEALD